VLRSNALLGNSVAFSADGLILAAGGPGKPSRELVYQYQAATHSWGQLGQDIKGNVEEVDSSCRFKDLFGSSAALSRDDGTKLADGGKASDFYSPSDSPGRIEVYEYGN
jgi:hypothetical protein